MILAYETVNNLSLTPREYIAWYMFSVMAQEMDVGMLWRFNHEFEKWNVRYFEGGYYLSGGRPSVRVKIVAPKEDD